MIKGRASWKRSCCVSSHKKSAIFTSTSPYAGIARIVCRYSANQPKNHGRSDKGSTLWRSWEKEGLSLTESKTTCGNSGPSPSQNLSSRRFSNRSKDRNISLKSDRWQQMAGEVKNELSSVNKHKKKMRQLTRPGVMQMSRYDAAEIGVSSSARSQGSDRYVTQSNRKCRPER